MEANFENEIKNEVVLGDQIKIAQRDKLLLEIESAKEELKQKWWQKSKFWLSILPLVAGVTILGFYIPYVVIPLYNHDLYDQRAENSKNNYENQLMKDSLIKLEKKLHEKDNDLENLRNFLQSIKAETFSLRDSIAILTKNSEKMNDEKNKQLNKYVAQLKNLTPDISGKWSSTYSNKDSWEIKHSNNRDTLIATFNTPGLTSPENAVIVTTAVYKDNGKFTVNLPYVNSWRKLTLRYDWTVDDIDPNKIKSIFTVMKSNDPSTKVGATQTDILTRVSF